MGKAEFKTRKEAAWAVANAASGGSQEQIRFLVQQGCIQPLCNLLTVLDNRIVLVALNGLEHILKSGHQDSQSNNGINLYAMMIEECYGMTTFYLLPLWNIDLFSKYPKELTLHYRTVPDECGVGYNLI
jgi:importin subunit alpha-1